MNNEPVAWISVLGIDHIGQKFTDVRVSLTKTDVADIPLYTHPVKELTDEQALEKKYEKRNVELQNMIIRLNAENERLKSTIYHQEVYTKYLEGNSVKELTDEEIHELWLKCWDEIEFAKAILRKAQEK